MSQEIIYSEQYGTLGRRIVYVKPPDQTSLVQLSSSLSLSTPFLDNVKQFFRQVFLPQGCPDSVSDDYYRYQLWDTLQAFCSTITGTLTTQAIMKGVGVGDTAATPFAAAMTWILKDGTGMAGRIIFAWVQGTRLDGDCKKWRLFADALNDLAMALELLLPMFMEYSMYILCMSTAMKSVVGVAGGATRAAITQHQAIRNNMADVSAKDGSQETFVNLCASVVGIIILATFDEGEFVWEFFTLFTIMHLFANYKAVRSLNMLTLNNARLNLLLYTFLSTETVSSPEATNKHEAVIVGTGLSDKDLCGFHIILGASLKNAVEEGKISSEDLKLLANFYRTKTYLLIIDVKGRQIHVCLPQGENTIDVVQGYFHAVALGIATCFSTGRNLVVMNKTKNRISTSLYCPLFTIYSTVVRILNTQRTSNMRTPIEAMMAADEMVSKEFNKFMEAILREGWSMDSHHITVDEWRGNWSHLCKNDNDTSEHGDTPAAEIESPDDLLSQNSYPI